MKFIKLLLALGLILPVFSQAESIDDESCNDALNMLKEDSKADYNFANLLLSKCTCFDADEDKSKAKECYEKVLECCDLSCPPDSDCNMKTINLQSSAEKGIDDLNMAIRPPPGGVDCICQLSTKSESIIAKYDKLLSKNQSDVVAWNDRGVLFGENCCFDEALRSFEEAIRINPDLAVPWYNKGVLLFEMRQNESLECFNRSVKINPDFAEAWFNRYSLLMPSQIDMTSPSAKEAMQSYDQALNIKPELENYNPPYLEFQRMA
jgi:tetratricopeptide (TPR) repeat protein